MSLLNACRNDDEIRDLLAKCMHSTELTALTFWPEQYESAICQSHRDLLDILDNPKPRQRVVVKGSRKSGKTSWLKAFVARNILFRLKHYIFYVSQSETHAMATTEAVKRMLIGNKIIKDLPEFGDIREHDAEDVDKEFSKKGWIASFPGDSTRGWSGTLVVPRGAGQQVRGILFDYWTPDLVVVDDLEDKKLITNDTIREQNWDYTISDVGRCFSHTRHDWQLVYLDTLKHEDAVIARLFRMKSGWDKHEMPMARYDEETGQYRTLMHPYITQMLVDEMVGEARENGTLDEFSRECLCVATSAEGAKFKSSYFRHYDEKVPEQGFPLVRNDANVQNIVLADPAKTTGDKSCKSAIVVWGIDTARKRFYLRHIDKGRYHPSELIERYLDYVDAYRCVAGGVEVTGLEEFIKWPLEQAMIDRNIFIPIEWCKARGKKDMRAGMLETIYRRGQVYHNTEIANLIEPLLLSYPRPSEWDVLDAAAYLFHVMHGKHGNLFLVGSEVGEPNDAADAAALAALDREAAPEELGIGLYRADGLSTIGEDRWMMDRNLGAGTGRRRLPRAALLSMQHRAM